MGYLRGELGPARESGGLFFSPSPVCLEAISGASFRPSLVLLLQTGRKEILGVETAFVDGDLRLEK